MKNALLLALVWVGVARLAHAQAGATEPFRRANTVWLYTAAPAAEVLRALADNLRQRGFALDSVAYEAGVVTTQPTIPPATESWPLVIRLVKVARGVQLTGTFSLGLAGPGSAARYPAEFWGFDWSPAKKTFREVQATAYAYGGQVRYSRRPVAAWGTVKR